MNKIKMFKKSLMLVITILIFSCDSLFNESIQQINESSLQRQELLKQEPLSQKELFFNLSSIEKSLVWIDKINQVLSLNLSADQKKVLLTLKNTYLKPSLFENNDFGRSLALEIESVWRKDAENYFSRNELILIVTTLDDFNPNLLTSNNSSAKIIPPDENPDEVECTCSSSSDWCAWGETCTGTCWIGSSLGCGAFFLSACDGVCI